MVKEALEVALVKEETHSHKTTTVGGGDRTVARTTEDRTKEDSIKEGRTKEDRATEDRTKEDQTKMVVQGGNQH
jgi:hypothetical protein